MDDRLYDAINLIKFSELGQGHAAIDGDHQYRNGFQRLVRDALATLWGLWSRDQIAFAKMGPIGDSLRGRSPVIRVNDRLEPAKTAPQYVTVGEQSKVAGCASNLLHEATHLVRSNLTYLNEEILCRTIQQHFVREIVGRGLSYRSRFAGQQCLARYLPTTAFYSAYMGANSRNNRLLSADLIDQVVSIREYRRDWEQAATASFIVRSLSWWGGLRNRWPSTRGYYLRCLAMQVETDYADQILDILESLTPQGWAIARTCAGDLGHLRTALRPRARLHDTQLTNRIERAQDALSEDFGIRFMPPSPR